jgi:urease accessory protein
MFMVRAAGMTTATSTEAGALSTLLIWFSPAFPIGAFSFSHGLEWAVEQGDVADRESLEGWLRSLISHGSGWTDACLFALAHRAAVDGQWKKLSAIAALGEALQPTAERRLESGMQGAAFQRAVMTGWTNAALEHLAGNTRSTPLAVVAGVAAAGAGALRLPAVTAYLTGFAQNLVSAVVRLAPIGQSDGLRVLAALQPLIARTAERATRAKPADIGGFAFRSDIASMRHETQGTRLFRS